MKVHQPSAGRDMITLSRWRLSLGSVLLAARTSAIIVVVLCAGCGRGSPPGTAPSEPDPVDVVAGASVLGALQREIAVTGTLTADEDVIVAAKVAGRVIEVMADVGDDLPVGAPLVKIDPVDFELALQERRLALIEALTELGLSELPSDGDVSVAELPAVARAKRQAENALARLRRAEILLEQDPPLISEQDYQDLRTSWEVSEQDHRLAELAARTLLARAGTLAAQVASAERVVADTLVLTPEGGSPPPRLEGFDSVRAWSVAERMTGPGAYVQPGSPLFRLVDQDPLKLRVAVPERRLMQVVLGRSVRVRVEGVADPVMGRVSRIAPAIDTRTRTFEVEILIPNSQQRLRPGGFARAAIEAGRDEGLILIPADALSVFAGVEKVFVIEDGRLREQRIRSGVQQGELLEVLSGLEPGLTLVRTPAETLVNGTAVRVVEHREITDALAAEKP